MALDKVLKIYDENGNPVDYDILSSDVKFNDGKDLPTKLAEMEDEIGEGGYTPPVGGIPKADLAPDVQTSLGKADTALQSFTETDPTVPLWAKQPNKPDYTAQEVGALPAYTPIPSKTSDLTNDSGFITIEDVPEGTVVEPATAAPSMDGTAAVGSSAKYAREDHIHPHDTAKQDTITDLASIRTGAAAGATAYQKPASGIPASDIASGVIPDVSGFVTEEDVEEMIGDFGTVESVTVGGTKHLPDANGDVDLGNLRGQDGNSGVASADGVESVNNLNGGTTDTSSRVYVLGANQGKRLRDQIDYVYARLQAVYAALGNIAFWDGKTPIANILPDLDWGAPKHTVTLALSLSHAVVKHNGVAKSNGDTILVEEGGTLTLVVEPADGYALTSVTSSTTGATVTDLGNGTYSVAIAMGGSDMTLNVAASAVATIPITYGTMTNCSASSSNPSGVASGGTVNLLFVANEDYGIKASGITISGASVGTITHDGQTYTVPITHDGTSQSISIAVAASEAIPYAEPEGGELLHWWDGMSVKSGDSSWTDRIGGKSVSNYGGESNIFADATKHCWTFNFGNYNTANKGLNNPNDTMDDIPVDNCTIEVVYKPTAFSSPSGFNRASIFIGTQRKTETPTGIFFVSKHDTTNGDWLCGVNAGGTNNGTWDMTNTVNEFYLVGMNNDVAVNKGASIARKTGAKATDYAVNSGAGGNGGPICIGCACSTSNSPAVLFHGDIYAIRIYRGKLTAAQMLANQKVDNERYSLGLTLPDSVQ